RTPGTLLGGDRKVPAMRSSSTSISTVSLRVPICLHHDILANQSDIGIYARKDFYCVRLRGRLGTEQFQRARTQLSARGIGRHHLESGDFGAAGAADAPRLFQHAHEATTLCIRAGRDVVISA